MKVIFPRSSLAETYESAHSADPPDAPAPKVPLKKRRLSRTHLITMFVVCCVAASLVSQAPAPYKFGSVILVVAGIVCFVRVLGRSD